MAGASFYQPTLYISLSPGNEVLNIPRAFDDHAKGPFR